MSSSCGWNTSDFLSTKVLGGPAWSEWTPPVLFLLHFIWMVLPHVLHWLAFLGYLQHPCFPLSTSQQDFRYPSILHCTAVMWPSHSFSGTFSGAFKAILVHFNGLRHFLSAFFSAPNMLQKCFLQEFSQCPTSAMPQCESIHLDAWEVLFRCFTCALQCERGLT